MTLYVVDASVVIKRVITSQPLADQAQAFFSPPADGSPPELLAPDLLYTECASALWKYARFAGLDPRAAALHLDRVFQLPIQTTPTPQLVDRALALGIAHGISVYDGCYVAMAEIASCPLITADRRLVRQVTGKGIDVQWLGEL